MIINALLMRMVISFEYLKNDNGDETNGDQSDQNHQRREQTSDYFVVIHPTAPIHRLTSEQES